MGRRLFPIEFFFSQQILSFSRMKKNGIILENRDFYKVYIFGIFFFLKKIERREEKKKKKKTPPLV
jgi:hypothetical protein